MSCNGATPEDVKEIIVMDDPNVNLTPFIRAAQVVVARVVTCATNKEISLSAKEQQVLETWLAAYYYSARDPRKTSESIGRASASYQRGSESEYLTSAYSLDPSGCLKAIMKSQTVQGLWLGEEYPEA